MRPLTLSSAANSAGLSSTTTRARLDRDHGTAANHRVARPEAAVAVIPVRSGALQSVRDDS
jgi:hypothetical protein